MIRDEALKLYRHGWCVLPMKPRTKQPALKGWARYQTQRPTDSTVCRWFPANADRGLAVVLGEVSGGLICRDFDQLDAYDAWAAEHPQLASRLPQSETGRGRHVFCRVEPLTIQGISPTGASIIDYGDGELRGGGLAVLPPSIHESGKAYLWLNRPTDSVPTVDLPATGLAQKWGAKPSNSPPISPNSANFTEEDTRVLKSTEGTEDNISHRGRGQAADFVPDFDSILDDIERAIVATLPTGPGKRNNAAFLLAQQLKGIGPLSEAEAKQLRPIVKEWHQRALPFITTKPFETTLAEFYRAWPKVEFPAGVLRKLLDDALVDPLPHCCKLYETYDVKRLIALCRKLGQLSNPKPFYLACRGAGDVLGVSHTTASNWLYLLTEDDVLELVEQGSQKTHRASRYFYRGD